MVPTAAGTKDEALASRLALLPLLLRRVIPGDHYSLLAAPADVSRLAFEIDRVLET